MEVQKSELRRSDLLSAGVMQALDQTWLPASLGMCAGCGQLVFTLGDLARHREVIDPGQPPTWENSRCAAAHLALPLRLGDDLFFEQSDRFTYSHLYYLKVHRLGLKGEPRFSYRFARHAWDCPCHTDSLYEWLLDQEAYEEWLAEQEEQAEEQQQTG